MPLPESRSRVVYKEWVRDPQGKLLEKPPPRGKRTENGIIWGHTLADFFWIPRLPGTNILTIWSRSMIQALGEHYPGNERHEDADPEPDPRRLRPWPVLTLPAHVPDPGSESASGDGSGIGYIDADCGHRHPREGAAHENGVPPTPNPSSPSSSSKQPKFSDGCGNAVHANTSPATCKPAPAPTEVDPKNANASANAPAAPPINHDAALAAVAAGTPTPTPTPSPDARAPEDEAVAGAIGEGEGEDAGEAPMAVDPAPASAPGVGAPSPSPPSPSSAEGSPPPTSWTPDSPAWAAARAGPPLPLPHPLPHPHVPHPQGPLAAPAPAVVTATGADGAAPADPPAPAPALDLFAEGVLGGVDVGVDSVGDHDAVPADVDVDADEAGEEEKEEDVPMHAPEREQEQEPEPGEDMDVDRDVDADVDVGEKKKEEEATAAPAAPMPDAAQGKRDLNEKEKAKEQQGDEAAEEDMDIDADADGAAPEIHIQNTNGAKEEEEEKPNGVTGGGEAKKQTDTGAGADVKVGTTAVEETAACKAGAAQEPGKVQAVIDGADAKAGNAPQPAAAIPDSAPSKLAAPASIREAVPTKQVGVSPPPPSPKRIFHDLPKLEEFIPDAYFPDILYVNDPDNHTAIDYYHYSYEDGSRGGKGLPKPQTVEPVPRKYKRVWPRFARDEEPATAFNTDVECASIKVTLPAATAPTVTPAAAVEAGAPPVVPPPSTNLRIAHLNLSSAPRLGRGNHSVVHRAALRLPTPLSARSPTGEATVAAKTGFSNSEARELLQNEGQMYGAFPRHLMEGWCGYNLVAPVTHPVPVGAVVPKFYGYYVPVREDVERERGEAVRAWKERKREERRKRRAEEKERKLKEAAEKEEKRKQAAEKRKQAEADGTAVGDSGEVDKDAEDDELEDDEDDEDDEDYYEQQDEETALRRFKSSKSYNEWARMSPILLLEECGSPIVAEKFTADDRSECFSLALRLHYAEFTQGSFYVRNILRQPGPLTVAPSERSDRTPSFRIIDFGRGEHWPLQLEAAKAANAKRREARSEAGRRALMAVPTEEEMRRRVKKEAQQDKEDEKKLAECAKKWWEARDYEVRKAHSELQIRDFNY